MAQRLQSGKHTQTKERQTHHQLARRQPRLRLDGQPVGPVPEARLGRHDGRGDCGLLHDGSDLLCYGVACNKDKTTKESVVVGLPAAS